MVTVNVGGLSEGVFESEMFGHVKGAFTDAKTDRVGRFDLADGGTLFLDEIANVPLNQQSKLLRVLETGELEVGRIHLARVLRGLGKRGGSRDDDRRGHPANVTRCAARHPSTAAHARACPSPHAPH